MNGISFSLYDALNKLIIGAIILLPLMVSGWWHTLCQDATTMAFCFTLASFLCGLALWLVLSKLIQSFQCLRSIWFFGSNNLEIIVRTFKQIKAMYPDYYAPFRRDMKKRYLGAYYRVQQAGSLGNVPTLEALSEFFKNLVFAVLFSDLLLLFIDKQFLYDNICCIGVIFIIVFIMSYFGRYYTETKIHDLVWEADYFLMHNSKTQKYERNNTKKSTHIHHHGCSVAVINTSVASSGVRL
jgi:hypothetical protein